MSFRDTILSLTRKLYPTGRAWKMPLSSTLEALHKGLATSEAQAKEDALSILNAILPDSDNFTEADATQWERRLGIDFRDGVSLEDRKAAILQKYTLPGNIPARQHWLYVQGQLQDAGFDVYVFETIYQSITEANTYGDGFQFGDLSYGGGFALYSGGEILANKTDPSDDASFVLPSIIRPIFYIANSDFSGNAEVQEERKFEFRKLLLTLKPVHSIGMLYVDYV